MALEIKVENATPTVQSRVQWEIISREKLPEIIYNTYESDVVLPLSQIIGIQNTPPECQLPHFSELITTCRNRMKETLDVLFSLSDTPDTVESIELPIDHRFKVAPKIDCSQLPKKC